MIASGLTLFACLTILTTVLLLLWRHAILTVVLLSKQSLWTDYQILSNYLVIHVIPYNTIHYNFLSSFFTRVNMNLQVSLHMKLSSDCRHCQLVHSLIPGLKCLLAIVCMWCNNKEGRSNSWSVRDPFVLPWPSCCIIRRSGTCLVHPVVRKPLKIIWT